MGIKGLNNIIKNHVKAPFQERNITYFGGSKFGIDSGILFYKCAHKRNLSGDPWALITGFLTKAIYYLENDIIPIFCFDGTPPEEKTGVIENRWARKEKIKAKLQELGDSNPQLSERLKRQIISVSKEEKQQVIDIIKLSGLPWVISTGEAEATCAHLQKEGLTDFTVTEDGDAMMFGCENFIKDSPHLGMVKHYSLSSILHELKLSFTEFLDLAILCGCDYCPNIPKIGPTKSLKLIRENGTMSEEIIKGIQKGPDVKQTDVKQTDVKIECKHSGIKGLHKEPDVKGLHKEPDVKQTDVKGYTEYWTAFNRARILYTTPVLPSVGKMNLDPPSEDFESSLKTLGIPSRTISRLMFRLNAAISFQK